jgi:uncharacterized membrane protein
MAQTIIGVFPTQNDANQAINDLQAAGFDPKNISIIVKNSNQAQEMSENTESNVAGGAVKGGLIGALAGLLIGIGAIAVPGVGALLIGGPIVAALGMSGVAAATASGAVTGILAGGLVGALVNLGVSEDQAKKYESSVKSGSILLMVPVVDEGQSTQVQDLMRKSNASQIDTFNSKF